MIETTDKQIAEEFYQEYAKHERIRALHEKVKKREYKSLLRGLLHNKVFEWLNEHDFWEPIGIYDIDILETKSPDGWQQCKAIGCAVKLTYVHCKYTDDYIGIDHYWVWQVCTTIEGDSYNGRLLLPLRNGKYFMVAYSC